MRSSSASIDTSGAVPGRLSESDTRQAHPENDTFMCSAFKEEADVPLNTGLYSLF